jgi:hypothetical protein
MPYGVGGAVAQGLQSGFEMGRSITQDAESKRRFDVEEERKRIAEERLAKQEADRYGRMQDAAQIKAVEDHLTGLDKLAQGYQDRGQDVDPRLNEMRAQAHAQLDRMYGQVASTGRLVAPGAGVVAASPRPNVASADPSAAPLPDLSQSAPPAQAQPAPGERASPT